jgi:hypothetical protein
MPARKLAFLRNGQVKQVKVVGDQRELATPTFSHQQTAAERELTDPPSTMTWRFFTRPMDLPTRPLGSYIRFTVGGRDVPTYAVRRSPTGNWGFIMESCWGVYASFEMPPQASNRKRRRLRRTEEGAALWVDETDETSGEDSGNSGVELLQDDSSLLITNELQWREAFLYNVGARILPEGDEAADDFDRAWGGLN